MLNGADRVYSERGGSRAKLKVKRRGTRIDQGYTAAVTLAVNPVATPAAIGTGNGEGSRDGG